MSSGVLSQQKKDSCCLTKQDLIGTWQRDSKTVGNGLNQNFAFFPNDTFVFNIGGERDDVRNIIKLKGRYRLVGDKLYFTILSRTVVEGKLVLSDIGVNLNLFQYERGSKTREIVDSAPKELVDPCYVTIVKPGNIKLNNEVYFKVNSK